MRIEIDVNKQESRVQILRTYDTGESSKNDIASEDLDDALNTVPGLYELYYAEQVGTCKYPNKKGGII